MPSVPHHFGEPVTQEDTGCKGDHDKVTVTCRQTAMLFNTWRCKRKNRGKRVQWQALIIIIITVVGKSVYCSGCSQAVPARPSGKAPHLLAWDRAGASVNPHSGLPQSLQLSQIRPQPIPFQSAFTDHAISVGYWQLASKLHIVAHPGGVGIAQSA